MLQQDHQSTMQKFSTIIKTAENLCVPGTVLGTAREDKNG